jgi:hypothetical protein
MNEVIQGDCLRLDPFRRLASSHLSYNRRVGQCLQHPRHGNLVSVGHMNTIKQSVPRVCPVCKQNYEADPARLRFGRQTTCSRKCSYALRGRSSLNALKRKPKQLSLNLSISKNPRLAEQKPKTLRIPKPQKPEKPKRVTSPVITGPCEYCGEIFTLRRANSQFCSVSCRGKSRRLPEKICPQCSAEYKPFSSITKYCSRLCFDKSHRDRMLGKGNPSWLDGRSYEKRCHRGDNWESQRIAAYARDAYTCQKCGVKCIGRRDMTDENAAKLIQCHHIVYWSDRQDNSLENLTTLCVSCHAKIHFGSADLNE